MKANSARGGAPAAGPAARPNPGVPPPVVDSAMERLLVMQNALAGGDAPATDVSPKAAPDAAPEGEEEPVTPAPGEDLAGEPSDEGRADLSQNAEGEEGTEGTNMETGETPVLRGELPAELAELPEDVREQLMDIGKQLADGTLHFGDIKRWRNREERHSQEVEDLNGRIQQLEQQVKTGGAAANGSNGTAAFKSLAEVQEREMRLKQMIRWCQRNPEGGEQNGQEFSAEEVKAAQYAAEDELDLVIPKAREQLQAQEQRTAQFTQVQSQAKANVLKVFPELKDPENPAGQAVSSMLSKQPWMKQAFISPETAAYTFYLGELEMRKLAKQRGVQFDAKGLPTAGAKVPSSKFQAPSKGAVVKGRPATGGSSAGARAGARPTVAQAMARNEKERSVGSLAALMEAADL